MTYILGTVRPLTPNRSAAGLRAMTAAANTGKIVRASIWSALCKLATLPGAFSAAFAMAYADPYCARRVDKDPSDPANF